MNIGGFQILAQLDAGNDGVSYRAVDEQGQPVEVRLLNAAKSDSQRWLALTKRLRLANLLDHPAQPAIRKLALDAQPPFVVLEWRDTKSLAISLRDAVPLPVVEVLPLGRDLASVLAAAHKLGMAHGHLDPSSIQMGDERRLTIDLCGTEVNAPLAATADAAVDASCKSSEQSGIAKPEADIFSLGAILFWLITGRSVTQDKFVPFEQIGELAAPLQRLTSDAMAADPNQRPSAREVGDRLQAMLTPLQATNLIILPGTMAETSGQAGGDMSLGLQVADVYARERLGRYKLLNKLGQGGMGAVFRAEDLTDQSIVAVKVIRPETIDKAAVLRRFHKEARLLAEVNNPFVANLLEVNEDDGIHYLVLEYVEGQNLSKHLAERGSLPEATALAVMGQVARALVEAHDNGIVHRDIKPDNSS